MGFPESFAAVAGGFTTGAESFKFSRGVLKILKLFLEMGDNTGNGAVRLFPGGGNEF
jgi:hypothetical protein